MRSTDEWRRLLGRPDLSDDEVEDLLTDLDSFLNAFLDDYLRVEFDPSDEEDAEPP